MNWRLLTAVFLPKMLTYHCFTAVDRGKNQKTSLKGSIYGMPALAQKLLVYLETCRYAQLSNVPCRSGP